MDAIECIKTRRSVRQYLDEPIDTSVLEDIAECGRLAATARNAQPVHIVVIRDEKLKSTIANTTEHGKFLANAPVCIVVLSEDTKYYMEDGSAASQNILLAAKAHGLGSCWIAGDKKPYSDSIRIMVGAPDGFKLISIIAIGKPAVIPTPAKKSLTEVLHWDKF
jgi:nitroreductase